MLFFGISETSLFLLIRPFGVVFKLGYRIQPPRHRESTVYFVHSTEMGVFIAARLENGAFADALFRHGFSCQCRIGLPLSAWTPLHDHWNPFGAGFTLLSMLLLTAFCTQRARPFSAGGTRKSVGKRRVCCASSIVFIWGMKNGVCGNNDRTAENTDFAG